MIVIVLFSRASSTMFNPAISLTAFLVGSVHFSRMGKCTHTFDLTIKVLDSIAQFAGAIAGVYLLAAVTPSQINVNTTLVTIVF
jgi:glycerol uptake facilitator-like aquaporin